ncbi:3073_t:CDS:2 [Acaulospora colombiana]|uniref:3073_t:CDS:1 n=1 Tax=Acaulospora colombiana TaxID=27376 RepID=A0ACA9LP41_9GLOM|nr:3073_t:CDS:2 [Acaulospora colombiana]
MRKLFEQVTNSTILLSMISSCGHMMGEAAECELCTLSTVNKSGTPSWSSGNPEIDRIISNSQSKSQFMFSHVEWIPFERLRDINKISRGGFGGVYSAWWNDGPMCFYGSERIGGGQLVAIKSLGGELTPDLLRKLETYIKVSTSQTNLRYELLGLFQCYGMTRNPSTGEYCLVMDYAKNSDLRNYLDNNYRKMNWISDKLQILGNIARGLKLIHGEGLIHGDLHSGNVLIGDDGVAIITDLILSPACVNESEKAENESKGMYGVLPFVAPEILQHSDFTTSLAVEIRDEVKQLEIVEGTPKCYTDFMKKCLDSDPKKRPTADDICDLVYEWYFLERDCEQYENSDNERLEKDQSSARFEKGKRLISEEKFHSQFIDLEAISKVERFEEDGMYAFLVNRFSLGTRIGLTFCFFFPSPSIVFSYNLETDIRFICIRLE